jgi:type I restriction enzyme R subunit
VVLPPAEAEDQAKAYATQLKVPYIFLANGNEIRFWEWQREAFPRPVKTFFSQDDLERRAATARARDVLSVRSTSASSSATTRPIASTPCAERSRPAAASSWSRWPPAPARPARPPPSSSACSRPTPITRVLFLVDRIPLAKQTEDAFAEHLSDYPAYVLRAGRRFQDEKRITITTLQSMVNIYAEYSAATSTWSSATSATAASTASGAACSSTSTACSGPHRHALRADVARTPARRRGQALRARHLRFFEVDRADLLATS